MRADVKLDKYKNPIIEKPLKKLKIPKSLKESLQQEGKIIQSQMPSTIDLTPIEEQETITPTKIEEPIIDEVQNTIQEVTKDMNIGTEHLKLLSDEVSNMSQKKYEDLFSQAMKEESTPVETYKNIEVPKRNVVRKKQVKAKPIVEKKSILDFHDVPTPVMKFVSTIISLIAITRSYGYTFGYFNRMDTTFYAILMALMMVLVAFIAPQILIIAYRKRKWLVVFLASILMIVFTYFDIWVTANEMTYKRTQKDLLVLVEAEDVIKAKVRLQSIDVEIEQAIKERDLEQKERDTYQRDMDRLTDEGKNGTAIYNNTRSRLNIAKERYDKAVSKIERLQNEKVALQNTKGLYTTTIKTEQTKKVESRMDLVFAIALDIAGPIFMAFGLFL